MAGETILHIGYDSVLLELRDGVLKRGNYRVVSVLGNDAARDMANKIKADMVVIGSAGRYPERLEIAKWLKRVLPSKKILVMCASPDEKFPDDIFQFYGDTPEDWLKAIADVFGGRQIKSRRPAKALGA